MTDKIIPEEHERRFVPDMDSLPFVFSGSHSVFITQGYLEDELRTRVRDEYDSSTGVHTYTQTRKSGSGVSRPEDEHEINKSEFDGLWLGVKFFLTKIRYFITWDGIEFEFNVFNNGLSGYFQIEKEFDSNEEATAFISPSWFGREVTDNSQHGNYSLAKFGKPKE